MCFAAAEPWLVRRAAWSPAGASGGRTGSRRGRWRWAPSRSACPPLADQAGEARNDIVGIFFLLAAVAIVLNAWAGERDGAARAGLPAGRLGGRRPRRRASRPGRSSTSSCPRRCWSSAWPSSRPSGDRWRALWVAALAALAGGGYWYLRNLVHTGNPLPWVHHLGPIYAARSPAGPGRPRSARRPRLPDRRHRLVGLVPPGSPQRPLDRLATARRSRSRRPRPLSSPAVLGTRSLASLARPRRPGDRAGLAPRPDLGLRPRRHPRGFESGLRYLAPALVLGLALLPAAPLLRALDRPDRRAFVLYQP